MPTGDPARPGPLMAIGGAEDKLGKRTVLKRFVALAGGQDARIAVIPTASSLGPEIVDVYDAAFTKLGAREVIAARPTSREEADDPGMVSLLDDVTGIFMTGGNQLKLAQVVNGTAFGTALRRAHERGVVIAGTVVLGLGIAAAVYFVTGFLVDDAVGLAAGIVTFAIVASMWWVLPLAQRGRR